MLGAHHKARVLQGRLTTNNLTSSLSGSMKLILALLWKQVHSLQQPEWIYIFPELLVFPQARTGTWQCSTNGTSECLPRRSAAKKPVHRSTHKKLLREISVGYNRRSPEAVACPAGNPPKTWLTDHEGTRSAMVTLRCISCAWLLQTFACSKA